MIHLLSDILPPYYPEGEIILPLCLKIQLVNDSSLSFVLGLALSLELTRIPTAGFYNLLIFGVV